jgi:hypothetical protein
VNPAINGWAIVKDGEDAAIHAHVADLHLVRDVPRAMTAQFSNSNGGMTRSFSTVHGKSRTTKPRPARQSSSLSGNAQTSRRRLAMTRQAVGEISMPIPRADFQGDGERFFFFRFCL